jgi:V/A-type H+-transporting ATPase subunit E
VTELEGALLERARALAEEYVDRGRRGAERVLEEANARLRLREEREVLAAKAEADRAFRRRVQAAELQLQGELDRLRWSLAQDVLKRLDERLHRLAEDEAGYGSVLRSLIGQAIAAIEADEVVVELNSRDYERLSQHWDSFVHDLVGGRRVTLASDPRETLGGALVRSSDDRERVDNTFEGRRERLQDILYEQIMEHLFATAAGAGGPSHG